MPRSKSVVGAIIDFRGITFGPVNEQGVVFLFSKVNEDLGIKIEEIKEGFPDAVGRRLERIGTRKGWVRKNIEFEYCSSDFRKHEHDPKDCDIIVCWEHDC